MGQTKGVRLLTNTKVVSCVRADKHKTDMKERDGKQFRVLIETTDNESVIECDRLVDCSGTWGNPNWIGEAGLPAIGERALQDTIVRGLPEDVTRFNSKKTLVVGSGASAITFIAGLINNEEGGEIVWVTRRPAVDGVLYPRIADDPLPQRDALAVLANELIANGQKGAWIVSHKGGVGVRQIKKVEDFDDEIVSFEVTLSKQNNTGEVEVEDNNETVIVHEIVAATGYRPDLSVTRELQVHHCYATEGPMKLAAALMSANGGGGGDCLAQVAPGPATLLTPEKGFLILGMKSYGRGSAFLLRVGIEQVQMAMHILTGRLQ